MQTNPRVIAFYLPQYHPIPQNDEWWGKGFTEWTNTAKAKTLFPGHYQPHVPADLGFYDLRLPEARAAQADLARAYGIEAFCYYHYWFAGQRLLERPFDEVLTSGEPDFPFCLCWANQTWTGVWHGAPDRILIEQTYPGQKDVEHHFRFLLQAFQDRRYLTVDGRPVFLIYCPNAIPEARRMFDSWRTLAIQAGLADLFLIGVNHHEKWKPADYGLDAVVTQRLPPILGTASWQLPWLRLRGMLTGARLPTVYDYAEMYRYVFRPAPADFEEFPCVIPNWDNTPRSGLNGLVLHNSTPELFGRQLAIAIERVRDKPPERQLVFLKSWNEWAEGNHVEPDLRFGRGYLEVIRKAVQR